MGDAEYFVRVDNGEFALGCQRFISTGWNQWEVVEAAAGAPALSGASLPTNQTGPEVRARWGNAALPGLMHGRFAGQQRVCLADCLPDCQLACLSGCKTTNHTAKNCPPLHHSKHPLSLPTPSLPARSLFATCWPRASATASTPCAHGCTASTPSMPCRWVLPLACRACGCAGSCINACLPCPACNCPTFTSLCPSSSAGQLTWQLPPPNYTAVEMPHHPHHPHHPCPAADRAWAVQRGSAAGAGLPAGGGTQAGHQGGCLAAGCLSPRPTLQLRLR